MATHSTECAHELLTRPLPQILPPAEDTATSSLASRGCSLNASNMITWTGLEVETMQRMTKRDWDSLILRSRKSSDSVHDSFFVSDERGLQGRFNENVGVALNWLLESIGGETNGLGNLRFGDPAAASEFDKEWAPDFAVLNIGQNQDERSLIMVGECKTFWTMKLGTMPVDSEIKRHRLAKPLGQLAAYMHRYKLRLGFLSTYDKTVFVKRQADKKFLISLPMAYDRVNPTIRQIFIHLLQTGIEETFKFDSSLDVSQVVQNEKYEARNSARAKSPFSNLALPESDIQGKGDSLQAFTANTLTIRKSDTNQVEVVELISVIVERDGHSVWDVLYKGRRSILKFWKSDAADAELLMDNECFLRELVGESKYIPRIYASGETIQGKLTDGLIIVMEKVEGQTFSRRMWSAMDSMEKDRFQSALCEAFLSLRQFGVMYGDPRPANVIWRKDTGEVKLLDWEHWKVDEEYCRLTTVDEDELAMIIPDDN